ncbi:MAG: hypothetical protein ABSF92_10580 [Candidatus Acidiferrales bacterium]
MTTDTPERRSLGSGLPFVLRGDRLSATARVQFARDLPTAEDPLPPALEIEQAGYILVADTRFTKVAQETTDDN